jgi:hypothetical protein
LRQLAGLRRWAVLIAAPGYLRGIGHVHALLARTPEVMSCRVEPIDSRGARMVLMTVQLELDEVTRLVQECSRRSGCPAAVRVVALGSAYDDADLR